MFIFLDKAIIGMALLRVIAGCMDILVALLMLRYNDIEKALILNSSLALVGPIIFIIATTIGLVGLADKISLSKFLWIIFGVGCILYGIKS